MYESTDTWQQWRDAFRNKRNATQKKEASALKAEDPTEKGEVQAKPCGDAENRSNINLPANPTANTVQDKDGTHGLSTVTKPNDVGEGEYPTPVDGNARDEAYKTPSTDLKKISNDLRASSDVTIPSNVGDNDDIMKKLSSYTKLLMADERGRQVVQELITKQAGREEAERILTGAYNAMRKDAAANAAALAAANGLNPLAKQAGREEMAQANMPGQPAVIPNPDPDPDVTTQVANDILGEARLDQQRIAMQDQLAAQNAANGGGTPPGVLEGILAWIKENPGMAAAIAGGTALGGYGLAQAVSGDKKKEKKAAADLDTGAEDPMATPAFDPRWANSPATQVYDLARTIAKSQNDINALYAREGTTPETVAAAIDSGNPPSGENVDPSTLKNIMEWIKNNPGWAAAIAGGTALGGYGLAQAVSGDKKKREKTAATLPALSLGADAGIAPSGTPEIGGLTYQGAQALQDFQSRPSNIAVGKNSIGLAGDGLTSSVAAPAPYASTLNNANDQAAVMQQAVNNVTGNTNRNFLNEAPGTAVTLNGPAADPGMLQRLLAWIKENPGMAAAIAGGTALGGYGVYNALSDKKKEKQASMQKEAAFIRAHAAWVDSFQTPIEKVAYQQGAIDGEMMANAAEDPAAAQAMGGEPIPADDSAITDEEVMQALQSLYESGAVTPEQVNSFVQQVQNDALSQYTAADIAMMLKADVDAGKMPMEVADALANQVMAMVQSGQLAMGPGQGAAPAPEQAPADPAAMEVQASLNRTADIYNTAM